MSGPPVSFEIQVLTDKNWVIAEMITDEAKAKAFADNLLQTGNHAAVRVVRDYRRADGLHSETVIQEKKATERQASEVGLCPITEAPLCSELPDFYGLPSRLTIGRLLRKYLDEVLITPSELLCDAKELKRFGDKGNLLFSGIDKVSTIQAAASGEDSKVRRDTLNKAWEQLFARARAAAEKKLPAVKTFAEVAKAGAVDGSDEASFLCRVLIARRLLESRSWLGKLDILLEWAAEPEAVAGMVLIDGIVADLMVPAQVIQDLLGFQANLAAALCHICDLAEGKAEAAKFAPATFAPLNKMFAEKRLPQAGQVLMSRVIRELGGVNPLSRNEPNLEFEMFHKLLHRLVGREGVTGGAAAAEALLQRSSRVHNIGDCMSAAAMEFLLSALAEGCLKVQFLVALAESPLGGRIAEALVDALAANVKKGDHIDAWVPVRIPPRERMAALTATNKALLASVLPEPYKRDFGTAIDEALARYLRDEGVIEKIDKPDDPLAMRAIRLIKFCGSGVLIDGKSLNLARARVIDHLRQPNFEEKFLASVPDPVQAEKHLREFHRLLVETGFK